MHGWIKNFLTNRKQRVSVNGKFSSWETVTSGVPQGSVLGPVLFLIYINDLPEALDCALRLFADDTKLFSTIKNVQDEEKLQGNIFNACEWANKWQMIFNTNKCKTMHIGKDEQSDYFIKDKENKISKILVVEQEKDLGVIFDNKLLFDKHISSKVKIANRNLGLISKNFIYLNNDMFLKLYKALVRPHLEYASVIWSPNFKKDARTIENVQRRATKMLKGLRDFSYPLRLKNLGLPTLEYRRSRADIVQVYKLINRIDSTSVDLLGRGRPTVTRGHNKKITKKRSRLNLRKNFFSNRIVNTWNKLPEEVVNAQSINAFKNRLNKYWTGETFEN